MNSPTVTLDVCADIRSGREPFTRIMSTLARLRSDENLLLVAPFEPKPLFSILAKRGFAHSARKTGSGDWEVLFTRQGERASAGEIPPPVQSPGSAEIKPSQLIEVDARGLEPPQPMVKILEALSALPNGAGLRAHTDRRPMHLYAQLESRGFTSQTEEQKDGTFITIIQQN